MKMRLPKLKMPRMPMPKPRRRLQASARRVNARSATMADYDEEPTTKLSSAFVVVLILHVVAVGGILAFNGIKANRKSPGEAAAKVAAAAERKPAPAPAETSAPAPAPSAPAAAAAVPIASSAAPGKVHHVRQGDSLIKIANLYNVDLAELREINNMKDNTLLRPGQSLNLPANAKATPRSIATTTNTRQETTPTRTSEEPTRTAKTATPKPASETKTTKSSTEKSGASTAAASAKTYTVAKGDNPVAIARKLGVSYQALLKLNNIDDPKKLQAGAVLKVPPKKAE